MRLLKRLINKIAPEPKEKKIVQSKEIPVLTTIKVVKPTKKVEEESSFLKGYEPVQAYSVPTEHMWEIDMIPEPEKPATLTRQEARESIIIKLFSKVEYPRGYDLLWIGNSKIDGYPMYRYIGKDFSTFNLPYEEMVSLDDYLTNTKSKNNRSGAKKVTRPMLDDWENDFNQPIDIRDF